jgi:hypothetical protein
MEFKLAKSGLWYKPAFDEDLELSKKVKQGDLITGKTERQRNYELHKKAFKVLSVGFENQEKEKDFECYRARVLIGIGHCKIVMLENGICNFIPKSISYEAIPDDIEFGLIYTKIVEKVASLLGVTNMDLALQVASHF